MDDEMPDPEELAAAAAASSVSVVAKGDLLLFLGYVILAAVLCEAVSWLFIYRRTDFERLNSNFAKASKRLEKQREQPNPKGPKGKDKKLIQAEREFEFANRDLIVVKSRGNFMTAVVHMLTFFSLKSKYEGVVLARLPFEPFGFLLPITHRGLEGNDMRECGVIFLYMLCSLCIKPNLQRLLGHTTAQTAIPLGAQRWAERMSGFKME